MNKNYDGLNDKEVLEARNKYGINEIKKVKKETLLNKILHIFTEPMFLLLIIASSIYFILGEVSDGLIMLFFVLFISGIEFIQERKTDRALDELNTLSSLNIKVIRNGKEMVVDSRDIVVGDIVYLEEGDKIPADGVILECTALGVNESALTGESDIVYKKLVDDNDSPFKLNMCYAGCDVTNGSAIIEITQVGINTLYGKIGGELNNIVKEKTPLEKQIKKLVVVCTIISLIFFVLVIIINFIYNKNLILKERIIHSILSGITVAMATIPEEIPVVLTVFLAMGAWNLAKENTLTRNMKAVETLGAITVLCTDKTGTLTQNKMVVQEIFSSDCNDLESLFLSCSKNPYDPMEKAIQKYCLDKGINKRIYDNELVREYAFNNEDKMMGQIWKIDEKNILCVKGAYESVLPLCDIDKDLHENIENKIEEYTNLGYRILAVAKNDNIDMMPDNLKKSNLKFVSLISLLDPSREGVKESIKSCYEAGVRVIMITGDNGKTASVIADQIGLVHNDKFITGRELEKMSDEELIKRVRDTNIFARVYPNHKMRIVKALQQNNEIVAMTGDGINDVTALKKAEIGIAMGKKGTSVSKEAADMILMDDNFNTIVSAIKKGRTIYGNIQKAISYILVIHIPIALLSIFTLLFNLPVLLLPIHIVLLELIIDPTSSIIFQRLKSSNEVMKEKPRKVEEAIIDKNTVIKCIMQGLVIFIVTFGSYYCLIKMGTDLLIARTIAFTTLVLANILVTYVLASNKLAIKNFYDNWQDKVIVLINVIILLVLLAIIYVPILNEIVGTSSLKFVYLLLSILLASIATLPFDMLKKRNKEKNIK